MNLDKRLLKLATTIRILRRLEKGGGTGRTIDTTPSDQVDEDPKYTVRVYYNYC